LDYFTEIACYRDIHEALERLKDQKALEQLIPLQILERLDKRTVEKLYPAHIQGRLSDIGDPKKEPEPGERLLSEAYPGLWRSALVDWFYCNPLFAALVWQQFLYCKIQRARQAQTLAEAVPSILPIRFVRRVSWLKSLHGWFFGSKTGQMLKRARTRAAEDLLAILKINNDDLVKLLDTQYADAGKKDGGTLIQAGVPSHLEGVIAKALEEAARRPEPGTLSPLEINNKLESLSSDLGVRREGPDFIEKLWSNHRSRPFPGILSAEPSSAEIFELISNRKLVHEQAAQKKVPVPFSIVHEQELEQILPLMEDGNTPPENSEGAAVPPPEDSGSSNSPIKRCLRSNLAALAFSGGGVRSATFNLGILQSLAKLDLLKKFHYLSTVSGGGYIGSWLHAWIQRESVQKNPVTPFLSVSELKAQVDQETRLFLSPVKTPNPIENRVRPIRFLREFSNYLTPKTGLLSADTWTMVAIYVRNLLLNLLVLLPAIALILLFPRLAFVLARWMFHPDRNWYTVPTVIFLCLAIALWVLVLNIQRSTPRAIHTEDEIPRPSIEEPGRRMRRYATPLAIQFLVVFPFLIGSWLTAISYWLWLKVAGNIPLLSLQPWPPEWQFIPFLSEQWSVGIIAGLIFLAYMAVIHWLGRFYRCWTSLKKALAALLIATLGAAAAAALLFWLLGEILRAFTPDRGGLWLVIAYGTPLALATYSLVVVVQLGLLGINFPDEQREWWSRLRAWTLIYSFAWAALFTAAIMAPYWVELIKDHATGKAGIWTGIAIWLFSTITGVKMGGNTGKEKGIGITAINTDGSKTGGKQGLTYLITGAPYVFIAGLLTATAYALYRTPFLQSGECSKASCYWTAISGNALPIVIAMALCAMVSIGISLRIGVNEFSMHHFYKNRLVRCYLGASRWASRKANWFTGFDSADDFPLSRLDNAAKAGSRPPYPGPYPILNAALNLVAGRDLAWQERKAASFIFTPKYCGYDIDRATLKKDKGRHWPDAYTPTRDYVNRNQGPSLGTAMAVSGAAANPNMGQATTSALAFLMTIFNVRLGWWLPNPRVRTWWDHAQPTLGLSYTGVELLSLTDDEKEFINVSDGGHFENLGVYELIRRGVPYIVACDAGQDSAFNLEDLGNLVRKVRIDFGVEIEIATDQIRDRHAKGWSDTHCVVGTIHYLGVPKFSPNGRIRINSAGEPLHETGLLLYLKPSITGDEPFDILEYYRRVPEFPHETTADQWFNESQFESYRKLGMHIAEKAFCRYTGIVNTVPKLFKELEHFWHPPSPKIAERSTEHTVEYSRIMELIRKSPRLRPLDPNLFSKIGEIGMLPVNQRDEFYICNALIQLMENVYADLDLEQNHNHPHVTGWMDMFRYWASQNAFNRTWEIAGPTYANRFRNFYHDRLNPATRKDHKDEE
jgi:hypothetical protein